MKYRYFKSQLGEGTHTAFRKAAGCFQAHQICKLIDAMPPQIAGGK